MSTDRLHNQHVHKEKRRELRNHATPAEAALWKMLRGRQLGGRQFRRQHSVGPYILDFYCPAERLAVELDGAFHADPACHTYDSGRAVFLAQQGIRQMHFENREVLENPERVLAAISFYFQNG